MRLIDSDKLAKDIYRAWTLWEKKGEDCYVFSDIITPLLINQPRVEAEQTILELSNLLAKKDKIIKELSQIRTDIKAEPTKHGRWELVEDDIVGLIAKCSVCGEKTYNAVSWDFKGNEHRYLYCPKCGARCDL